MPPLKDLSNQKIGRLSIIRQNGRAKDGNVLWLVKCDCGNMRTVSSRDIGPHHTRSCGCWKNELSKKRCIERKIGLTHGMSYSRMYNIWNGMIKRCQNVRTKHYQRYGGRGIKVCNEWQKFAGFLKDLKLSYDEHVRNFGEEETTLDRINNDGHYEPSNCRWATWKEQALNR